MALLVIISCLHFSPSLVATSVLGTVSEKGPADHLNSDLCAYLFEVSHLLVKVVGLLTHSILLKPHL